MKVSELIDQLRTMPQDAEVYRDDDAEGPIGVSEIKPTKRFGVPVRGMFDNQFEYWFAGEPFVFPGTGVTVEELAVVLIR